MSCPDKYDPSTWVPYKPSLCKGCWAACCTLPVQVTSEELYHLGYLKMEEVSSTNQKIADRLIKKGIIKSFNKRTGHFRLLQKKNGDCVFLDKNRLCTVYESRPSICRQFPKNSVRPGFCPHEKK